MICAIAVDKNRGPPETGSYRPKTYNWQKIIKKNCSSGDIFDDGLLGRDESHEELVNAEAPH
jgi:hypothetical protein